MKTFFVYEHPSGDIKAVKNGWSWLAFLVGIFFALYYNLPFLVTLFLAEIDMGDFFTGVGGMILIMWYITPSVVFGIITNNWVKEKLIKAGYVCKGSFPTETPDLAIWQYKSQQKDTQAQQAAPSQDGGVQRGAPNNDVKNCPYCGEQIKKIAILCRYCRSTLSEKKPAESSIGTEEQTPARHESNGTQTEADTNGETPDAEYKSCPYCGEQIKKIAIKCRYCKRDI